MIIVFLIILSYNQFGIVVARDHTASHISNRDYLHQQLQIHPKITTISLPLSQKQQTISSITQSPTVTSENQIIDP